MARPQGEGLRAAGRSPHVKIPGSTSNPNSRSDSDPDLRSDSDPYL